MKRLLVKLGFMIDSEPVSTGLQGAGLFAAFVMALVLYVIATSVPQ